MKCYRFTSLPRIIGRSSHEERGLKSMSAFCQKMTPSRSSHEERGLKCRNIDGTDVEVIGRSSHEERGLKSNLGTY